MKGGGLKRKRREVGSDGQMEGGSNRRTDVDLEFTQPWSLGCAAHTHTTDCIMDVDIMEHG